MESTVEIIDTLIDGLRVTSKVTNVSVNGTTYIFTVEDLLNIAVKDEIIFSEISLKDVHIITEINQNNKTFSVVSKTDLSAVTEWKSASPYYLYGTPNIVNEWLKLINKSRGLFVLLFTPISEPKDMNIESSIERNASLEMYFMKYIPAENWLSKEHNSLLENINSVVSDFLQLIKESYKFAYLNDVAIIDHRDWGTFLKDKGYTDRILDQKFSGVQLNLTLPIKQQCQ